MIYKFGEEMGIKFVKVEDFGVEGLVVELL